MNMSSYSFKLGEFPCWVINDGKCPILDISTDHFFKSNIIALDTMVLLVKTESYTILFDTGWGAGAKAAPFAGLLAQNLEASRIQREEINVVIFSHAHLDHIGGNIDIKGNPLFPNARYFMFRKEWEFWTSNSDFSNIPENIRQNTISSLKKNLFFLKDKIILFEGKRDILPGISYIETPGHTPGHITVIISSGTKRLLCLFDAFHHTIEIERPDLFGTPPMTGEAAVSRVKILSQVRPDDLIFGGHFPFPGLGHIVFKDGTRLWQPINH